ALKRGLRSLLLSLGDHEGSVGVGGDLPAVDERGEVGFGQGAGRLQVFRPTLPGELLKTRGRVFWETIAEEFGALSVEVEVGDRVTSRYLGESEFDRLFSAIDLDLHSTGVFYRKARPL